MFEPIPASVETAIYLYFLVVATIGLSVHWRLWRTARVDSGPAVSGE
jgi:hypothetical protein